MNVLTPGDFTAAAEPFALFDEWFAEAKEREINDPNAMALATVDADGLPNLRMVLLKGSDAHGFVFYTNEESAKGRELAASAGAPTRHRRRGERGRGGRLFRLAPPRQPHRRLGKPAISPP